MERGIIMDPNPTRGIWRGELHDSGDGTQKNSFLSCSFFFFLFLSFSFFFFLFLSFSFFSGGTLISVLTPCADVKVNGEYDTDLLRFLSLPLPFSPPFISPSSFPPLFTFTPPHY